MALLNWKGAVVINPVLDYANLLALTDYLTQD